MIVAPVAQELEEMETGLHSKLPMGEMALSVIVGIGRVGYDFCLAPLSRSAGRRRVATLSYWVFALALRLNGLGRFLLDGGNGSPSSRRRHRLPMLLRP